MKTIFLMRHAKSSWDDPALTDHDRPLNKRGLRDLPVMASWLARQSSRPDWCLSSTALRAEATARGICQEKGLRIPCEQTARLYHASPEEIVGVLRELPEEIEAPLIVSHNPGLEELVALWSGRPRPVPTAAIIEFQFPDLATWPQLTLSQPPRELVFVSPKHLPNSPNEPRP